MQLKEEKAEGRRGKVEEDGRLRRRGMERRYVEKKGGRERNEVKKGRERGKVRGEEKGGRKATRRGKRRNHERLLRREMEK